MQDEKATSTIAIKQRERRLAKKRQEEEREMMELEDYFSYQLRLYARKLEKMEEEIQLKHELPPDMYMG